jgi:3'-phosphoadenosine 5'-phosphosulfate (PAPS) 3'-phosphatase
MVTINPIDVKRHGNVYIKLGQNRTAIEGFDGNMPTLIIRENGKQIKTFKGSSLRFNNTLTTEDKEYLASLGSDK